MPAAAIVLNLPLLTVVATRLLRARTPAPGENFVIVLGGWSVVAAGALAWARGGGHELDVGVTTRYVDFLLFLPIANAMCVFWLVPATGPARLRLAQAMAGAWALFLLVGWLGLSAQVIRGFILPRMHDRDLPVRLAVAFQQSGDPAVFAGQHPYFLPHPHLESVWVVLHDPRMHGALPPSFQPERPLGPLSRAVRWVLGRN
jgi:hypothetical protein